MLRYYRFSEETTSYKPVAVPSGQILYLDKDMLYKSLQGSKALELHTKLCNLLNDKDYVLVPFKTVEGRHILLEYEDLIQYYNESIKKHTIRR